jgi:hypothetical protein
LTFLGVFTRKQGEKLVTQITKNGTSFLEMMNYVSLYNNVNYQEIFFSINSVENIKNFVTNYLKYLLPDNCCTVAKLNRNQDATKRKPDCRNLTEGHSVVFSKMNNEITTIDPQQMTKRVFIETPENFNKIFKAWSNQCYETVSLIFQPKTQHSHIHITTTKAKDLLPIPKSDTPIRSSSHMVISQMNVSPVSTSASPMDVSPVSPLTPMDISPLLMKNKKMKKTKTNKKRKYTAHHINTHSSNDRKMTKKRRTVK